ncbi:MAG: hypothetical protein LBJ01_09350 [Tannerella sp.]|nr:hypothetical protein [Tannerella sp.]
MLIAKHRQKRPSIILLGGSNVAFGFNSEMIQEALDLPVINTGLGVGLGLKFMLDNTSKYLAEGDILVIAPEYEHFFNKFVYGKTDLAVLFYLDPSISTDFDMKQFKIMIDCTKDLIPLPRFFPKQINKQSYHASCFNEYGDYVCHWTMPSHPYILHASLADFKTINTNFLDYYENAVTALRSQGIQVVIIPPSLAETSYNTIKERLLPLFSEFEKRDLSFSISPQEFVYPDSLFFDICYHLGYEGVLIRTNQLITLMKTGGFVR